MPTAAPIQTGTIVKIGELSNACGVDAETIRYYEREGLMRPAGRLPNGYRTYGSAHIERLAFIRHCRALDIPLSEIRSLLHLTEKPEQECKEVNRLIEAQLATVRKKLDALRILEKQLRDLRRRCGNERKASECGILNELVAAAHDNHCPSH